MAKLIYGSRYLVFCLLTYGFPTQLTGGGKVVFAFNYLSTAL
jgi:hypothetical protein